MPKMKTRRAADSIREIKLLRAISLKRNLQKERETSEKLY